jgi:transcriptional regulatory protein LevR
MNAALAAVGSLIVLLLGVLAFFLMRLISQLDTTTKTVDNLSLKFAVYIGQENKHKEEIAEFKNKVSLINRRLIAMRFKAESAGWKFKAEEWDVNN